MSEIETVHFGEIFVRLASKYTLSLKIGHVLGMRQNCVKCYSANCTVLFRSMSLRQKSLNAGFPLLIFYSYVYALSQC